MNPIPEEYRYQLIADLQMALKKSPHILKPRANVPDPTLAAALSIVQHLELSNWKIEKGEPLEPHGV